jgi:hypothetical protein
VEATTDPKRRCLVYRPTRHNAGKLAFLSEPPSEPQISHFPCSLVTNATGWNVQKLLNVHWAGQRSCYIILVDHIKTAVTKRQYCHTKFWSYSSGVAATVTFPRSLVFWWQKIIGSGTSAGMLSGDKTFIPGFIVYHRSVNVFCLYFVLKKKEDELYVCGKTRNIMMTHLNC